MRSCFHVTHVRLAKFFDVPQYIVQLLLKNIRLRFSQIYPRQPGDVRNIEIRSFGHDCRSRMQMTDQPDHCRRKRCQKKQKNDLAFPPLFTQRTWPSGAFAVVKRASALRRNRDVESLICLIASYALFRPLRWRSILRGDRPLCNHALEFVELLAQFCFLSRYILLSPAKRRGGSARTTKHRHQRLAIQKKRARATAPNIISGKVSAIPICNH